MKFPGFSDNAEFENHNCQIINQNDSMNSDFSQNEYEPGDLGQVDRLQDTKKENNPIELVEVRFNFIILFIN